MQCISDCLGFNNINTKPRKVRLGAGGWSCACLNGSEAMSKQVLKDAKNNPRNHKREFISLGHGAKLKKKKNQPVKSQVRKQTSLDFCCGQKSKTFYIWHTHIFRIWIITKEPGKGGKKIERIMAGPKDHSQHWPGEVARNTKQCELNLQGRATTTRRFLHTEGPYSSWDQTPLRMWGDSSLAPEVF